MEETWDSEIDPEKNIEYGYTNFEKGFTDWPSDS